LHLTLARVREFLREPEAVFWVFVFPVLLTIALGIAFRSSGPEPVFVGVEQRGGAGEIVSRLGADGRLEVALLEEREARSRLRAGKVALIVVPGDPLTYWYDPTRPESRLARLTVDDVLQRSAGRRDAVRTAELEMTETGSRYIDFLVPGLLGMNMMGTGMWGIGFSIVMSRSKFLLKRLVASPMRRSHYMLAQMLGRLTFLILEVGAIVLFARFFFDVPMRGSLLLFALTCVAGSLAFAGMGLLVASRARTIEGVSGLMNVVMMPMWICSGVFFSTSRFPELVQPAIQLLPLTALIDALRAIMLDGAGGAPVWGELGIVATWAAASFAAALAMFRWN
jgi:ABC-type multidrug transport system permease subunit